MSNITATFRGQATLAQPTIPTIYNKLVTLANTEVSQVLNANTQHFTIRARGLSRIRFSFVSGESGTKFITVPKGCTLSQEAVNFTGVLYLQTDKPNETVEILEWI